jgi:hypothetical protein
MDLGILVVMWLGWLCLLGMAMLHEEKNKAASIEWVPSFVGVTALSFAGALLSLFFGSHRFVWFFVLVPAEAVVLAVVCRKLWAGCREEANKNSKEKS